MKGEVVHGQHVVGAQGPAQDLADIRLEHFGVGVGFNGHANRRAIQPEGTDHRSGAPVTLGVLP
jgi:hypothetical protein